MLNILFCNNDEELKFETRHQKKTNDLFFSHNKSSLKLR